MYPITSPSPITYLPIFNPQGLNKLYKVQYKLTQQLPVQKEVIIKYVVEVAALKSNKKNHIIQINRTHIESNNSKNHAYELAEKCGQILFPIQFNVSEAAQITGLHNHQEIVNRWLKQSPLLLQYYSGEAAEDYIKETEQNILNPDAILNAMRRDLFCTLYFSSIYLTPNQPLPAKLSFPGITNNNESIFFEINTTSQAQDKNEHSLFIEMSGKWFEKSLPKKEKQPNLPRWSLLVDDSKEIVPLPDATVEGMYELNKTTHQIESIFFAGKVNTVNNQYQVKMQIN